MDVNITNQSVTINYTSDPDIYMESRISSRTMSRRFPVYPYTRARGAHLYREL